jgi:hypothetical protein
MPLADAVPVVDLDCEFDAGGTFTFLIQDGAGTDPDGGPFTNRNFTGYTVQAMARIDTLSPTPLFTMTAAVTAPVATSGTVTVTISNAQVAQVAAVSEPVKWSLRTIPPAGEPVTVAQGIVNISRFATWD